MKTKRRMPGISQLKLAELWGQHVGDQLCGPLSLFALVDERKRRAPETAKFRHYIESYFSEFAPRAKPTHATTLPTLNLVDAFARMKLARDPGFDIDSYRVQNLDRPTRKKTSFLADTHALLGKACANGRPVILQIGAYSASVDNERNRWRRGLGHFVVLLSVSPQASRSDGFFQFEYWDPWDAETHQGIVYEEVYRDFVGVDLKAKSSASETAPRWNLSSIRSPTGHPVTSPFLNVLAPKLDLYDPEIFFAQRYVYLLERALL